MLWAIPVIGLDFKYHCSFYFCLMVGEGEFLDQIWITDRDLLFSGAALRPSPGQDAEVGVIKEEG